ncbi:MAG TPA: HAD family hydrolase [Kiritimatiellia bacterium]|nr:HAD family hydrolase [Kiritimatiellia bacterium]
MKGLFVDRDGTLNGMVYDGTHGIMDSPRRPEQVALMPHAGAFLRGARELGYRIVVVTNQPGIAKGTLTEAELEAVNGRLGELLEAEGAGWDDLLYCPFHPDPGPGGRAEYARLTDCRKPGPGMLLAAAEKHGIDLGESWMVGDGLVDVQAGRRAGCRTLLVSKVKLNEIEQFFILEDARPDALAGSLKEALEVLRGERAPLVPRSDS